MLDLDPGNDLELVVRRREGDGVVDHHVPVDALALAVGRAAAAGLEREGDLLGVVGLVVPVVRELEQLGAEELLRPMALLAGFPGRAQVLDGRGDRSLIVVGDHGQNLARTGELGTNVPAGALTHVAGDARHARVCRVLIGRELRLHRDVANLAAEVHGFREMEPLVGRPHHEGGHHHTTDGGVREHLALMALDFRQ